MKPEKFGLPGSVAIIGLIYVVALAAAPETGLSAHSSPTWDPTGPVEYQTAPVFAGDAASLPDVTAGIDPVAHPLTAKTLRACPYIPGMMMSFAELMQVHHRIPERPAAMPGGSRLTIF